MNRSIAYFAPEAVGSPYEYFTDGRFYYQRIQGLGALGTLNGWLKRAFKKVKRKARKIKRGVFKRIKKVGKIAKKVGKVAVKVIHKALPIVNTALTFIPGVGWAAKTALTVAEIGMNAAMRTQKRKQRKKQMGRLNRGKTTLVKKVRSVRKLNPSINSQTARPTPQVSVASPIKRAPVYTLKDFIRINKAVTKNRVTPAQVAAITKHKVNQNLQSCLNF